MKYKGTHLRLPLIGLAQARLLLALLRQASYWLCSGRPLIGFVKPIGRYWNISCWATPNHGWTIHKHGWAANIPITTDRLYKANERPALAKPI